jgi:acetyl-CoA C-acetyltransferase
MSSDSVVIVSAQRTPTGSFQGILSSFSATDLGGHAIKAAYQKAKLTPLEVQEVFMGCVLPAALGQAPARQAALKSGLDKGVGCTTVNKVCGSGLKAVMLAHDLIKAGTLQIVVAGGMESMTNAPYMLPGARQGYRLGHQEVIDHMMFDGLQDSFTGGTAMGIFAEATAEKCGYSRENQDTFAIQSAEKALQAQKTGAFKEEITPLESTNSKKETVILTEDEPPQRVKLDKVRTLKPAFKKDGTLTAANSSSISDGAAAVVLMTESEAKKRGLKPLARIIGHAGHSQEPEWFTLAPIKAVNKLLKAIGWDVNDVDLFEINEAFGVVALACAKECKIPAEKLNVHGGACALGHPIGASGARILTTLLYALKTHGKKRGIASLCIGGGEAVAIAVESLA